MAKPSSSSSLPFTDLMEDARSMLAFNPMLASQMEHFWKAQDTLVAAAEAYSRGWFKRRHEATETALEVVHQANGNGGDLGATMRSMADWQQQSFQRLYADTQQWLGLCSSCARSIMNEEMQAGQEALDTAGKQAKAGTAPKHATPL